MHFYIHFVTKRLCKNYLKAVFTDAGYIEAKTRIISTDFSKFDDLGQAFNYLSSTITNLFKVSNFSNIRRACIVQNNVPSGARLSPELVESIKRAKTVDELIDEILYAGYWTWMDLSLMDAMAAASGLPYALQLVQKYRSFLYSKPLNEVLPSIPSEGMKSEYYHKLCCKINKSTYELTVQDLVHHKRMLEDVILDIKEGFLDITHIKEGCIEVEYCISSQMVFHAYQQSLKNRNKFSSLHI